MFTNSSTMNVGMYHIAVHTMNTPVTYYKYSAARAPERYQSFSSFNEVKSRLKNMNIIRTTVLALTSTAI